jgi:Domain of unknown function (DUF1906)
MMLGLDCDFDVSVHAPLLKAHNIGFVGQYLRSWLTPASVARLHADGIKLFCFWEVSATRALQGGGAGAADGGAALVKMKQLGAPDTAAICFTIDTDVGAGQEWSAMDYFYGADGQIWQNYFTAGYADGTALTALRADYIDYAVLAGAIGWDGSRAYAASGKAHVIQGPTLSAGGAWPPNGLIPNVEPIEWPNLGFAYDPLIGMVDEFGAW